MKSVENLLNKARLIHDGRSNTTNKVKSAIKYKKVEGLSENSLKCEKQPQKKEPQQNKIHRPKSGPIKKTSGSFQTTYNKHFGSRPRAFTKPKNSTARASPSKVEEKEPAITRSASPAKVLLLAKVDQAKDKTPPMQLKTYHKQSSTEISKVKLDFNKFVADLEVPPKTKKLLKSYEKLKDSTISDLLSEDSCEEESIFMQNLSNSLPTDRANECLSTIQTLRAFNNQLEQCLVLCNKCEAVLKNQQSLSPYFRSSKVHWTQQEQIYLEKETHKLIKEFFRSVSKKFKQLSSRTTVINAPCGEIKFDEDLIDCLSSEMQGLQNSYDYIPYPASSLGFQSVNELSYWKHETQRQQSLVIEKNLLKQIAKVFIPVIAKTLDSNDKKQSSRPEVILLLKNAYGILAQKDILLPAFVVTE